MLTIVAQVAQLSTHGASYPYGLADPCPFRLRAAVRNDIWSAFGESRRTS